MAQGSVRQTITVVSPQQLGRRESVVGKQFRERADIGPDGGCCLPLNGAIALDDFLCGLTRAA